MHYPFRRKGGISMTCTKDYREHIEYTFHAFCKVVIRNATITAARARSRKCRSMKSADGTGAAAAQRAIISEKPCGSYKRKWREWRMRNSRLLPYETIVQATSGEPEAVNTVLQHYRSHIRYAALVNGQIDQDTEDYITQTLLTALFKFRFEG